MKSFIAFWKKDIINKLIVIAFLALAGGGIAFGVLIFNLPVGMSFSEFFTNSLPARVTPIADTVTPTVYIPAFTTSTSNPNAQPTSTIAVATVVVPTSAPTLALTTPTLGSSLPTSTLAAVPSTQVVPRGSTCIPANPSQTGKVVEILDGNTVRIMIGKLIYVVRYTGVEAPKDKKYIDVAKAENSKLVYGKEVTLVTDVSDKDSRGRLLRYVTQGNIFINQKMIEQGFGSALDVPPDSACAAAFKQAQQSASSALLGMWGANVTVTATQIP